MEKRPTTPFAKRARDAFRRALYPLNFLLSLILIVQALAFYAFCKREFPLPDFANAAVARAASAAGFDLRYSGACVSVDGSVKISGVTLRAEGTPSPFFSAERVDVSFWPAALLNGSVSPRDVRVYGGAIGDTVRGVEEAPAVSRIYLCASKTGRWWRVESAQFKMASLAVAVSADISDKFSVGEFLRKNGVDMPSGGSGSGAGGGIADRINAAVSAAEKYSKYLEAFSSPVCSVDLFLSGAESSRGRLVFYSGSAAFPTKRGEARFENPRLFLRYDGGKISDGLSVGIRAEKFSCGALPQCGNISASANLLAGGGSFALSNIYVSAGNMEYEGFKLDNVSMRKDFFDMDSAGESWEAFAAFGDCRFGAKFSLDESMRLAAEFSGSLDPKVFTGHKSLSEIRELRDFEFKRGLSLKGSAKCDFSGGRFGANADFEASDCSIMGIPVRRASGRVDFDSSSGVIDASKLEVQSAEGWKVSGRFVQNLGDMRYKIYVDGSIRPMAIAHFMAPWWSRVFKSFEWAGGFPKADFFVEGKWGSPEFIWCYGRAQGGDAVYNGSKFDEFSLNVWVNPSRISLYDIRLRAQNRNAHGNVQWLYGKDGITTFDRQTLFLVSGLSSAELVSLGGDDVRDVFDVVKFSEAPQITVGGLMRNPRNNPGALPDVFNVSGFAPGETHIETAVLKNLRFSARSDKATTRVDNASFDFCGGHADGNIAIKKENGKTLFEASAMAEKMNQTEFAEFLMSLDTSKESGETEPPAAGGAASKGGGAAGFLDGGESGLVDLSLNLKGDIGDIAHSKGSGFASVQNPNLMRLNLLGALSRAFSALRLPFGTFDITYANSRIEIGGGKVDFPKLEMGGDVMRIRGAASYDFVNDDVDAALLLYPLGGMKGALISGISTLVSPISSVIQVTVDGKISDPSVGMQVRPLNFIQSESKILENIRDSF